MKTSDLFELVVRLSGYFAIYFAGYAVLNMLIGGMPFSFKSLLFFGGNAAAGVVVLKMAPAIKDFAYGTE